jgi:hypothetical protein
LSSSIHLLTAIRLHRPWERGDGFAPHKRHLQIVVHLKVWDPKLIDR